MVLLAVKSRLTRSSCSVLCVDPGPSLGLITVHTSWAKKAFFIQISLLPLIQTFCKYYYAPAPTTSSVKYYTAPDWARGFFLTMGFDDVHKALNLIPVPYSKHLHKIRQIKRETGDDCCNLYLLPSFLLWILFNASYQKKKPFLPREGKWELNKTPISITQHPSSRFSPTSLAHSVPSAWNVQLSLIHLVNCPFVLHEHL